MRLDPEQVRRALASHAPQRLPRENLAPAAVLVPLFARDGEEQVLFTRRPDTMPHHRGEISFPGGRRQPEDPDLLATALRETEEEMGIAAQDVRILGRLDDFFSVHGYHVTPFVGCFPYPYTFRVNVREVAEVITVPLARLRDPAIFHIEDWSHRGRDYPVHFYQIDHHQIWGLTAAILTQFLDRITAR
ncbi:CoA pyrophosphatase [Geoalkalibacter halelectricus]|uniref:CoA pyrophosphatase n=1 Tax=Geoalkalibacter halelectricus TaxID=2847045 RepID=A0ABY5ZIP3_9BACT|nr:CoA pyrophosphatase [Geoalkalibacter halelectricus]MDO3378030.1 CoA pyrophosphatase [Geoalkalibacter halelectricus]UWZ78329.1 CoA pyrophosphatase [Geoalkalibacter halelectricus]